MFASFLLYYDFNHRVVSHYPLIVEWFREFFNLFFISKTKSYFFCWTFPNRTISCDFKGCWDGNH